MSILRKSTSPHVSETWLFVLLDRVPLSRCIQVVGLRKVFGGTRSGVVAVDDVHMEMYENQVGLLTQIWQ